MTNSEGQRAFEGDVALALRLLNEGYTPEEVETALEVRWLAARPPTALTDPNNVLMQEVTKMAQPRGPIEIKGVTTRTNTSETRSCPSCLQKIDVGVRYERVARDEHTIECYHVMCFEEEFGARELYGD
jgi:hypothetical protein